MNALPQAAIPGDLPLVLASGSPRRSQLLKAAGYSFTVDPAGADAECGMCSRETAPELVARYAFRKAQDVLSRHQSALILAADTVASVGGQILGKPHDDRHAAEMLRTLSGRKHDVYTGVCLWRSSDSKCVVDVVRTELVMEQLSDAMIADYLKTMLWEGKAGAFGYQDGNDWIRIVDNGSESNVVGLPMERLKELLETFDEIAETIDTVGPDAPTSNQ
ncbi:Maf family protein [Rhodopirellula sp. MGV]|uniref:Maf family protein n=1 Tax=Rhodopirellula sp. MGV TaxID=2023130 RepID=UPI000B9647D3|nr:nucleoside triphosphate pyrophosphatase [Rhodopirellula sp. MGV]OYP31174.1 septum formation protein Maf [Rhodopirellula sp. MGV]PNY36068.1 septum formation protein Maf [Rhodopirellula baltica]